MSADFEVTCNDMFGRLFMARRQSMRPTRWKVTRDAVDTVTALVHWDGSGEAHA